MMKRIILWKYVQKRAPAVATPRLHEKDTRLLISDLILAEPPAAR